MEGNKVIGAVIAVIVIIIIIMLLVWWFCSNKNCKPSVDPKHVKCLGTIKKSLTETANLTRVYIVEAFTSFQCRQSTLAAIERQYFAAYKEYFGGCNSTRAQQVTAWSVAKFPLYDAVIADPSQLAASKAEAHRLNLLIAEELVNCGKKGGKGDKSDRGGKGGSCGKTSKVVQLLDNIDKANFDQITFIQQNNCNASLDAYYASQAATANYFKWLVNAYCQCHGVDTSNWQ